MTQLTREPKGPFIVSKWISILYRQFQVYFNQNLKAEGISSSEYIYLLALYQEDGLSQDILSGRLFVDKAGTARAIKKLEEKHYVVRKKDPKDKRVNHVHITDEGLALKDKIFSVLDTWNNLIIDDMSLEEMKALSDKLEHLTIKVRQINFSNKEKHQNE